MVYLVIGVMVNHYMNIMIKCHWMFMLGAISIWCNAVLAVKLGQVSTSVRNITREGDKISFWTVVGMNYLAAVMLGLMSLAVMFEWQWK